MIEIRVETQKHTYDEIGRELIGDWHNDLLKRVDVVGITKAARGPRDVDGPIVHSDSMPTCAKNVLTFLHQVLSLPYPGHRNRSSDRIFRRHVDEWICRGRLDRPRMPFASHCHGARP